MCIQNCIEICRDMREHSSETSSELYINWSVLVSASYLHSICSEIIFIILH